MFDWKREVFVRENKEFAERLSVTFRSCHHTSVYDQAKNATLDEAGEATKQQITLQEAEKTTKLMSHRVDS